MYDGVFFFPSSANIAKAALTSCSVTALYVSSSHLFCDEAIETFDASAIESDAWFRKDELIFTTSSRGILLDNPASALTFKGENLS